MFTGGGACCHGYWNENSGITSLGTEPWYWWVHWNLSVWLPVQRWPEFGTGRHDISLNIWGGFSNLNLNSVMLVDSEPCPYVSWHTVDLWQMVEVWMKSDFLRVLVIKLVTTNHNSLPLEINYTSFNHNPVRSAFDLNTFPKSVLCIKFEPSASCCTN